MFDEIAIYNKTEAGVAEVESRSLGLRAELRRLLILVDGNSPVSRLAKFVRGTEIASLIFELETQGLITSPTSNAYRKTDAGVVEVQARALGLRPELRRLLILVDGHTALSRMAVYLPGLPILNLIAELETAGLIVTPSAAGVTLSSIIAPVAPSVETPISAMNDVPASPPALAARPPVSDERLLIVRTGAARGLRRILGLDTHELLDKLRQPGDSLALRAVISEIHQTLEEQFGVEIGQAFLDSVRGSADNGRNLAS